MSAFENDGPRVNEALIEERAEDLYEQAPCGYLSTLPDGTLVKVNQTLLDWLGRTRETLPPGTKFQALLTIGSKIYYETHYAPLLRMQGFAREIALELVSADGRVLPVLLNASVRRDDRGEPVFTRITIFDATDRRRYEHELLLARRRAEQAARDKADLIAMLSHDIRNPLNALMGIVELLDRGELTPAQRRSVRTLKSSSEHMLKLLNHVLELSKAESSTFALSEAPFAFRAIVDDVMATFEGAARAKGLELRASVDDEVPSQLVGDPVALRQVLTNLVGNAVKFTERGSVALIVKTKERAADAVTLEVAVADTGVGIAPDAVDRIFKAFTQASPDTAERFGGTGLGLAIVRRLLTLYGSRIQVASVPGEGSTFSFSLRLLLPRPGRADG